MRNWESELYNSILLIFSLSTFFSFENHHIWNPSGKKGSPFTYDWSFKSAFKVMWGHVFFGSTFCFSRIWTSANDDAFLCLILYCYKKETLEWAKAFCNNGKDAFHWISSQDWRAQMYKWIYIGGHVVNCKVLSNVHLFLIFEEQMFKDD